MTQVRFNEHKNAQACINYYADGSIALQSYSTIVVEVTADGWVNVNGLYSATTRKHIGWFARLLDLTYQDIKNFYENNITFNYLTGEIKEG